MDEVEKRLKGSIYMNLGLRYDGKPDYLGNLTLYVCLFGFLIPYFILIIYYQLFPIWLIFLMIIIIMIVTIPLVRNLKRARNTAMIYAIAYEKKTNKKIIPDKFREEIKHFEEEYLNDINEKMLEIEIKDKQLTSKFGPGSCQSCGQYIGKERICPFCGFEI